MRFLILFIFLCGSLKADFDPYWAYTTFLSQWAGADGATTATEQAQGAVLTFNANAQIDTAQFPTGMTSSLLLDGTGDFISTPDTAGYDFGTGDWTIEGFVRFNSVAASQNFFSHYVGGACGGSSNCGIVFRWVNTNNLNMVIPNDTVIAFAWTPSTNTWYHWAATKASGSIRAFIAGSQVGSTTANTMNFDAVATLQLGRTHTITDDFNGWMGPVRITKGIARYTAAFTPPTLPMPATGESQLSPYLKNSNRLDLTPPKLLMWLMPSQLHAMSSDNKQESQRNQAMMKREMDAYQKQKFLADVTSKAVVTATPTPAPKVTATRTPTPGK